jgi:hypothetical protein
LLTVPVVLLLCLFFLCWCPDVYFLFDLPGQVELYTHHSGLKRIVEKLSSSCSLRLTCVHLVDSHHCADSSKFLSVLLLALASMTQLELPHVNVLSKMDLVESYGPLEFGLDFYTDVMDLKYLLPRMDLEADRHSPAAHPLARKLSKLHAALADMVESYNLVSFVPLDVSNTDLMKSLLQTIDKANGALYVTNASAETGAGAIGSTTASAAAAAANRSGLMSAVDRTQLHEINVPDIQERYMPQTTQEEPPRSRSSKPRPATGGAPSAPGQRPARDAAALERQLREFEQAAAAPPLPVVERQSPPP